MCICSVACEKDLFQIRNVAEERIYQNVYVYAKADRHLAEILEVTGNFSRVRLQKYWHALCQFFMMTCNRFNDLEIDSQRSYSPFPPSAVDTWSNKR